MTAVWRARGAYVTLALVTIVIGLVVHMRGSALGGTVRDVLGDALWAMMIVWWIGALLPRHSLGVRVVLAIAVCAVVEFGQLFHTTWLDGVRATRLGHLVLGSGFDARDLLAYACGVLAAAGAERFWRARRN